MYELLLLSTLLAASLTVTCQNERDSRCESDMIQELRRLLYQSVLQRTQSDVPIGV